MQLESISVKSATTFYSLVIAMMNGESLGDFREYYGFLIEKERIYHIERSEYFGQKPKLHNLAHITLPEACLEHKVIHEFMRQIPSNKWNNLSIEQDFFIGHELPFFQRINRFLLPYKTRIVSFDFRKENNYILSVPLEEDEQWAAWQKAIDKGQLKLSFYPALDDVQVLAKLSENLGE